MGSPLGKACSRTSCTCPIVTSSSSEPESARIAYVEAILGILRIVLYNCEWRGDSELRGCEITGHGKTLGEIDQKTGISEGNAIFPSETANFQRLGGKNHTGEDFLELE